MGGCCVFGLLRIRFVCGGFGLIGLLICWVGGCLVDVGVLVDLLLFLLVVIVVLLGCWVDVCWVGVCVSCFVG